MKKNILKYITTYIGICFLSISLSAQSVNDQILSGVQNPTDYETIELAQMDPNLSTFMNLVALSGFGVSWKLTAEDHSVLIPTNQAFDEMSVERYLHLTDPANKGDLMRFVKYHFLPNKVSKRDFNDADVIDTEDEQIEIAGSSTFNTVYLGGAKVIKSLEASDGIVHVVNGVVQPTEDFLAK